MILRRTYYYIRVNKPTYRSSFNAFSKLHKCDKLLLDNLDESSVFEQNFSICCIHLIENPIRPPIPAERKLEQDEFLSWYYIRLLVFGRFMVHHLLLAVLVLHKIEPIFHNGRKMGVFLQPGSMGCGGASFAGICKRRG